MAKKIFPEERMVFDLASEYGQVRYATPEEDHGSRKADIVVMSNEREYYLQISRNKKSRRQEDSLMKRGTIPVYTHTFEGTFREAELRRELSNIFSGEHN